MDKSEPGEQRKSMIDRSLVEKNLADMNLTARHGVSRFARAFCEQKLRAKTVTMMVMRSEEGRR